MRVINTKIKDLKIIKQKKHGDKRGYLRETFRKKIIKWDNLIFDYCTTSKKNALRDAPADSAIGSASDTAALKAQWNTALLGTTPYT